MKNIKPILMNEWSISRISVNEKTQTRRLPWAQPLTITEKKGHEYVFLPKVAEYLDRKSMVALLGQSLPEKGTGNACRGFSESDLLSIAWVDAGESAWVRETWAVEKRFDNLKPSELDAGNIALWYKTATESIYLDRGKWRPSIFMPRWASRYQINYTDIRFEKLTSITKEDAKAEGAQPIKNNNGRYNGIAEFVYIWNKINDKPKRSKTDPWGRDMDCYISYPFQGEMQIKRKNNLKWYIIPNPYVLVYEFKIEITGLPF